MLVAHNAPFDIGFLKAACALTGHEWPGNRVLDTARLARQVVTRDEAPNCKLASLARLFRAGTTPDHRALSDARATVDVLHGMLERLGNLGVRSLDELSTFSSRVSPRSAPSGTWPRRCRTLPGVYQFVDERGEVLYVGKSKDLRSGSAPTSPPARPAAGWPRWSAWPPWSRRSCAPPRSRPRSASCG